MSKLRHRWLRKPHLYLGIFVLSMALVGLDATRPPQRQISVALFARSVDLYHEYVHPLTERYIRCRYRPTCSRYSVEAVRKYGIAKGMVLALRRISSCRRSVPMGTVDPIP